MGELGASIGLRLATLLVSACVPLLLGLYVQFLVSIGYAFACWHEFANNSATLTSAPDATAMMQLETSSTNNEPQVEPEPTFLSSDLYTGGDGVAPCSFWWMLDLQELRRLSFGKAMSVCTHRGA